MFVSIVRLPVPFTLCTIVMAINIRVLQVRVACLMACFHPYSCDGGKLGDADSS